LQHLIDDRHVLKPVIGRHSIIEGKNVVTIYFGWRDYGVILNELFFTQQDAVRRVFPEARTYDIEGAGNVLPEESKTLGFPGRFNTFIALVMNTPGGKKFYWVEHKTILGTVQADIARLQGWIKRGEKPKTRDDRRIRKRLRKYKRQLTDSLKRFHRISGVNVKLPEKKPPKAPLPRPPKVPVKEKPKVKHVREPKVTPDVGLIQVFTGKTAHADKIKYFLRARRIDAKVVKATKGKHRVVVTTKMRKKAIALLKKLRKEK